MTHALSDRAMVVNLSIGLWQGYRLDKAASASITRENNAATDAARVNKHLVPKEALASVVKAAGAIRTHFYEKTMPWRDNGDRLLTRVLYIPFIEEHERLVTAFNREVEDFVTSKYPSAVEQAGFRMGDLHNPDDYPSPSLLRRKFYVDFEIDAITTADDFRVQIDQEHVDKVRQAMEKAAEQRVNAAMQDVWKRLADTVGYFAERMGNPDAVFRDSTVTNIVELIDLIPGLNVLDDPDIERVRREVKAKLTGIEAKEIRKDPALREELAGEAQQIMDTMAGFLKAFGGGDE
jgi:hypothetical protein